MPRTEENVSAGANDQLNERSREWKQNGIDKMQRVGDGIVEDVIHDDSGLTNNASTSI